MSCVFIYCITLFIQFYYANPANVLGIFPHTGKSHQMVFDPLLRKLAERGHNVTVASFFPLKDASPFSREVSFEGLAEVRLESFDLEALEHESILYRIPRLGRIVKQVFQMHPFKISSLQICERLIDYKPLLDVLKESYDIVLVENFTSDCVLGLLHVYGITAPVVALLSGTTLPWSSDRIGFSDNPSYVPVITSTFGTQMSFLDRVENTLIYISFKNWFRGVQDGERAIIEKKYGRIPSLYELGKNTSLMFVNAYNTLSGVKPMVPGYVEVGGMHLSSEKKPLPRYIEKFLNESSHGVILFSFGSHIKTKSMPKYKQEIFINALSKLKQRVLWKFEDSDPEGTLIGNNILRIKWIRQYDLLRHEKIVAFISHGGMLGTIESTSAGKPMIVMPIFGDQPANAAAAAESGIGVVLSYRDLNEELLDDALQRVLSDEMRAQAAAMSRAWHDRDTPPLDLAVAHTERALRHAAPHCAARDLPAYQRMLLDVAIAILATCATVMALLVYCILKMVKMFKRDSKQKLH